MIIKITLNDNDFGELLEGFCQSMERGYPLPCPPRDAGNDLLIQYFQAAERWRKIYQADSFTPEEKAWYCDQITQAWAHRVQNYESRDYLIKNFECSFVDAVTGAWENGEAFYFFPGAYGAKFINL